MGSAALIASLLSAATAAAQDPPGAKDPAPPIATAEPEPSEPPDPGKHKTHALDAPPPSAFNPRMNEVRWDPRWPKFRTVEYIATGLMGITVFASLAIPPEPGRWRDVTDFDKGARNVLRLGTQGERITADDASDLVLGLMVNQLIVDATLVAWWGHDRPSVGFQMVLIDLETLAFTGAVHGLVSGLTSRWRPYRDICTGPVERQNNDCRENKQYRSFFSGHTSGAFTAAGLMCMHHLNIPLYGGGVREKLVCAGSFAAAAVVGTLRVVADQHFATDALVGAAFGTVSGLGLPWLLHYRGGATPPTTVGANKRADRVSVNLVPYALGVAAMGEF